MTRLRADLSHSPYRVGCLLLSVLFFAGCALVPGIAVNQGHTASGDATGLADQEGHFVSRIQSITPALILEQSQDRRESSLGGLQELLDQPVAEPYHVGPLDVLQIVVWNHPELTNPAGLTQNIEEAGRVVRSDGTMFYPYVGSIEVAGLTTDQIRAILVRRLAPFIQSPQVDVRVASFRSQKVYVTGEVSHPGILRVTDVPLTVMDAINLVGGFNETADRRLAVLTREGRNYPVNIQALYARGENNPRLRDGDVLFIPDNLSNKVFVLGEVNRQFAVPMDRRGRLTLMEAISGAEGFDLSTANTGAVYVFRGQHAIHSETSQPSVVASVYELDARQGVALILADRFQLQPRDIVFVSASGLVRYNRVMQQILPTVQFLFQADRLVFDR